MQTLKDKQTERKRKMKDDSHCHFVKVYSECTGATCEEKYRLARSILARCSDAIGNIYEPLDKPRKEMVIPA